MCYKKFVFIVLLLMNIGLFAAARDIYISLLPHDAVKVGDMVYKVRKDYDTSLKRLRKSLRPKQYIRDDALIIENGFRIHAFHNLKSGARWHSLYLIEEDGKVIIRIFK